MKTTRRKSRRKFRKTCGRGQGCTKMVQPQTNEPKINKPRSNGDLQEFYQPSINKDQKIIEDRFMRSAAAAQRRIDFEKEMAKINMEYNDKQILRKIARASQPPRVIRNTIQRQGRGKKSRRKFRKTCGGGNPMNFGMLFSIPRNESEANVQIPNNISVMKLLKPSIIGLVSPMDLPDDSERTRTKMWKLFADELYKAELSKFVMQHIPYTTVGNIGKTTKTKLTMDIIQDRLSSIKTKGIENILALKGWEENENYLKPGEVSAPQPEYLFSDVPEWIRFLKPQFNGFISASTYMEGHPFRRNKITEENKDNDWWAVKQEYTITGETYLTGILMSNLILGIKYDIEKIKAGANKIICNLIFDHKLYLLYQDMFNNYVDSEYKDKFEMIPEIPLGFSKKGFYNDVLRSMGTGGVYCSIEFQDSILKAGQDIFKIGDKVLVLGKGDELLNDLQRKNYYPSTITNINSISEHNKNYNITFDTGETEANVPILRISSDNIDREVITVLWFRYMKDILIKLKDSGTVSTVYILSVDIDAAAYFIEDCLSSGILKQCDYDEKTSLKGGESTSLHPFEFGGIRLM